MSADTILLLEDEDRLRKLLVRTFRHYNVLEAATAEQALQQFNDHDRKIDLLIADVTLPTSSGIQVALVLRSKFRALPVILTSGYPVHAWTRRDSADLKRLGRTSVTILQKPFPPQALREAVQELIGAPEGAKAGTA
jgi:two-component system cell cycle sensor histidine kinase/response regulator CckA